MLFGYFVKRVKKLEHLLKANTLETLCANHGSL